MAHPKHQAVRVRYSFCCGYCGISETDTGGELTVDHFHALSRGGDDSNANLVYACFRCNLNKGDMLTESAGEQQERRLLHPLLDNMAEHIQENRETGRLEGRTPAGTFQIEALRLNRAALIANRQQHWQQARIMAELDQSRAESADKDGLVLLLRAEIRALREQSRHAEEKDKGGE